MYSSAGLHNNTGFVYEYKILKYENFSVQFLFSTRKQQKRMPECFEASNYIIIMADCNVAFTYLNIFSQYSAISASLANPCKQTCTWAHTCISMNSA